MHPENFMYDCEGTPCSYVLHQPPSEDEGVIIYPSNITSYFPDDPYLPVFDAQAYAGVPLKFPFGKRQTVGVLGVLSSKPFPPKKCQLVKAVLQSSADWVSCCLQMKQMNHTQPKDDCISQLTQKIYKLHQDAWEYHQQFSFLSMQKHLQERARAAEKSEEPAGN